ncbi:hypothetical protein [Tautonia rosea]|nr:hypothetical protein [Tautonia rosea]
MNDSILKRYSGTRGPILPGRDPLDDDDPQVDDLGCYSWLRGLRERSTMIEFRLREGRSVAFDYTLLRKVIFDPSEGITLKFDGETVRIEGRNLAAESTPGVQLLRGIQNHRVPWIREMGEAEQVAAAEVATVVERLTFKDSG